MITPTHFIFILSIMRRESSILNYITTPTTPTQVLALGTLDVVLVHPRRLLQHLLRHASEVTSLKPILSLNE